MNTRVKAQIKELIKRGLDKFGYQIKRFKSGRPNPIHLWNEHNQFNDIMKHIIGFTIVDKTRCFMVYQYAKQVSSLSGDVAEVGVYKGGTARLLATTFASTGKTVYLFDTFSGMPQVDPSKDLHKTGDFSATSFKSVKGYLRNCKNVCFYQGLFPTTA